MVFHASMTLARLAGDRGRPEYLGSAQKFAFEAWLKPGEEPRPFRGHSSFLKAGKCL